MTPMIKGTLRKGIPDSVPGSEPSLRRGRGSRRRRRWGRGLGKRGGVIGIVFCPRSTCEPGNTSVEALLPRYGDLIYNSVD